VEPASAVSPPTCSCTEQKAAEKPSRKRRNYDQLDSAIAFSDEGRTGSPDCNSANGPQGPRSRGLRYRKSGSVSRRRSDTEPSEAPVQSKQHALDVDTNIVAGVKVVAAAEIVESAVIVEIVEIGEAILARSDR
jgi:hypothetical protein